MATPNQMEILEKRKNQATALSKPGFGIAFEYPKQFTLKFDEEVKDVLMLQFLVEISSDTKGEFTIIAGPDQAKTDLERAMASLELITNMVGPELFKNVNENWVSKNLEDCPFGENGQLIGKKMILRSPVINFGIYFINTGKLKYHFFVTTVSNINTIDVLLLDMFKTVNFSEPVVVLSPLIGETFREFYDNKHHFSISYPESYELNTAIPDNEGVGEKVTLNNASCPVEIALKSKESTHGITIRVIIEKTKINFRDYVELFKLQLTKSRVLLAATKETRVKMCYQPAVEFEYSTSDSYSHIKRVGIVSGHAIVISIDHFGTTPLRPEKLFNSILNSFKYYGIKQEPITNHRYTHFDKNFSVSFPEHCTVLYNTPNVVVISLSKKTEESHGCFIQILDFSEEPNPPKISEIYSELLGAFQNTCTILYKQEAETKTYGAECLSAEFLIDGTWFVNPILNHPHLNSKGLIRVVQSPRHTFLFCFINSRDEFNKTFEQYGRLMLDSFKIF